MPEDPPTTLTVLLRNLKRCHKGRYWPQLEVLGQLLEKKGITDEVFDKAMGEACQVHKVIRALQGNRI
jgi:hypothetical protein